MAKDNPPKVRQHQGGLFFHCIASFMKLSTRKWVLAPRVLTLFDKGGNCSHSKRAMTLKKKRQRSFLKASPSANEKSGLSRAKRGGESPGLQGGPEDWGKLFLFIYS